MATAGTAPKRAYRCIVVNIVPGNPPIVDLDPVHVSEGRRDEVVWECAGGANFEVIFETDSPFQGNRFDNRNNCSGPAKATVRVNTKEQPHEYKYTVRAGGGTLDPTTIVDP